MLGFCLLAYKINAPAERDANSSGAVYHNREHAGHGKFRKHPLTG